jgi:hypothetical protein
MSKSNKQILYQPWNNPNDAFLHQRFIYDAEQYESGKTRIVGIITGYGSGKTYTLIRKAFWLALQNQPFPGLVVAPTYTMLVDIILPEFFEFLDDWQIEYTFNEQRKRLNIHSIPYKGKRIKTSGLLRFRSGDNPRRLKGSNIAFALIDEPFIQDEDVFKQVVARVRHPKAANKLIVLTGTPETDSWGEELLTKNSELIAEELSPAHNGEVVSVKYYDTGKIQWVLTSSEINTALNSEYYETLRELYTSEEIEAYIHGKFVSLRSSRMYYAYSELNDVNSYVLDYSLPVIVMCDFNATDNPMSWNIAQEKDGKLFIRYALYNTNTNTSAMCDYLYETLLSEDGRLPKQLLFYGDYSGKHKTSNSDWEDWQLIETYFRQRGKYDGMGLQIRIKPCKSVRGSAKSVNARLCNSVGERKIFLVSGSCTEHLRQDLKKCIWDKQGIKEDTSNKMRGHSSAALRYYVDYEYPLLRPITYISS